MRTQKWLLAKLHTYQLQNFRLNTIKSMNLVIINYVMDPMSQVLSWQTKVAYSLSNSFEKVVVLTHEKKNILDSEIPPNVEIIVFPLFFLKAPMRWLGGKYLLNFWVLYLNKKYNFDRCFIHMNFEWAIYLAPVFSFFKIPVIIWYAHGSVTKKLIRAHQLAIRIVSSTIEGFRIPSNKLSLIGQSVDLEKFKLITLKQKSDNLIYVGRISERKNLDKIIDVLNLVVNKDSNKNIKLLIVGDTLTDDDENYKTSLLQQIETFDLQSTVIFKGHLQQNDIIDLYKDVFAHISYSSTGSLDKTLVESLAVGCPVLTSNDAMVAILDDEYHIKLDDINGAANLVNNLFNNQLNLDREKIRSIVIDKHDYKSFIKKLVENIKNIS
jgi:glycosyltransferase involved in cell wall biosynthesis